MRVTQQWVLEPVEAVPRSFGSGAPPNPEHEQQVREFLESGAETCRLRSARDPVSRKQLEVKRALLKCAIRRLGAPVIVKRRGLDLYLVHVEGQG